MDLLGNAGGGSHSNEPKATVNGHSSALTNGRQRRQDLRRARGEISCAECSRLKIRCDKKVPCSSCVRRGCSPICPNGSTSGPNGSKFFLTDTAAYQKKLNEMSERIRQLEDGLGILQASCTSRPHLLLAEDLLAVKNIVQFMTPPGPKAQHDEEIDNFETLSITPAGYSRYMERSPDSETLRMLHTYSNFDMGGTDGFPITDSATGTSLQTALAMIEKNLPPYERAWGLCETYLEQCSWLFEPINREQLMDGLLSNIYKRKKRGSVTEALEEDTAPLTLTGLASDIALLLMVFAMGSLADLTLTPFHEDAGRYYRWARMLLNLDTVSDNACLSTVQSLVLMAVYLSTYENQTSLESSWCVFSLASVIGRNIGLHRDPIKWKLDSKVVQRRRCLFWQLCTLENWQSLASGRPMTFNLKYCDCEIPLDEEESLTDDGQIEPGYWGWKFSLAREIIAPGADLMCSVGPVKYSDILNLDRKIREFPIPHRLRIPAGGSSWEDDGPKLVMQRFTVQMWLDVAMLSIHRGFYAKALTDSPTVPANGPFIPSVLASVKSSFSILRLIRSHYAMCPSLLVRFWSVWKQAFSAIFILGIFVVRVPEAVCVPTALVEISEGIKLFSEVALFASRAKRALSALQDLYQRAQTTVSLYRDNQTAATVDISDPGPSSYSTSMPDSPSTTAPPPATPLSPDLSSPTSPTNRSLPSIFANVPLTELTVTPSPSSPPTSPGSGDASAAPMLREGIKARGDQLSMFTQPQNFGAGPAQPDEEPATVAQPSNGAQGLMNGSQSLAHEKQPMMNSTEHPLPNGNQALPVLNGNAPEAPVQPSSFHIPWDDIDFTPDFWQQLTSQIPGPSVDPLMQGFSNSMFDSGDLPVPLSDNMHQFTQNPLFPVDLSLLLAQSQDSNFTHPTPPSDQDGFGAPSGATQDDAWMSLML